MAFTFVNCQGNNSASSSSLTTANWASTAGDTVACVIAMFGQTINTVTDANGKVFTVTLVVSTPGGANLYIAYGFNVGANAAYNVNVTTTGGPNELSISAAEFTPPASTTVSLDVSLSTSSAGNSAPSVTLAGVTAGDLVVGGCSFDNTVVETAGGSFTLPTNGLQPSNGDANTHQPVALEYNLNAAGGSTTVAFGSTVTSWAIWGVAFKAVAGAVTTSADDFDAQSQRFTQSSRMESQHQQELSETFGILPPLPPLAFEDDGANMRWSDWRALQYEDPETQRALPPVAPFSIQEEFTEQLNVDWRARQFEDTDTHRALPPTPPAAVQDEVSERALPGVVPFFEEEQPGKPIVAAPAPNIGLDDIEAHIKAFDRINVYHEDDLSTFAPIPPVSIQDDEQHTWRGLFSPAIEDDWSTTAPAPPFALQDEISERGLPGIIPFFEEDQPGKPIVAAPAPNIGLDDIEAHIKASDRVNVYHEDDQATLPPIPPLPPFSLQDDDQYPLRSWVSPVLEDDWSTTAPAPPFAFEDDLKAISQAPTFFSITDTDLVGVPPVPQFFGDDEQSLQRYVAGGLSALIVLDEFVGAPVAAGLGPASLASIFAAVRPAIDSLGGAVRPAIDSRGAATRPAIDSQSGTVRPS